MSARYAMHVALPLRGSLLSQRRACTAAQDHAAMTKLRSELEQLQQEVSEKQRRLRDYETRHSAPWSPPEPFTPSPSGHADYSVRPLIQSQGTPAADPRQSFTPIPAIASLPPGQEVTVRARVRAVRLTGKMLFLVLRQQTESVQCVLKKPDSDEGGSIAAAMKWIAALPKESIVDVSGTVVAARKAVSGCSVDCAELAITGVSVVSCSTPVLPFQLSDAASSRDEGDAIHVLQSTRLDNRWLDMRTPTNNAIWKLQSRVCQAFREFLTSQDFVEIHTPKIIPTASESGATVFRLGYLGGKDAYLAQSPQLYKQMALQGDLHRVFEVGPVFRAEDSNTHRHLCEFTGLDVEMVIHEHYYEVLDVAERVLGHIFASLQGGGADLIAAVQQQHPHEDFVHTVQREVIDSLGVGIVSGPEARPSEDEYGAVVGSVGLASLRLSYPEGIRLLNTRLPSDAQWSPLDDMSTESEKLLGGLVKERYGVDFYILDKYPLNIRPFYTMPHAGDAQLSNSYDMFMRGEEISSGAQRVHDPQLLLERCKSKGLDVDQLAPYLSSFTLGSWPHGGFGIGLERVVMLFLGLPNVRACSMFPRDPKRHTP